MPKGKEILHAWVTRGYEVSETAAVVAARSLGVIDSFFYHVVYDDASVSIKSASELNSDRHEMLLIL